MFVAAYSLLIGDSEHAGEAELYFEVDTWQKIKIGNVKILLVTPQRVEGCNFLCSCQETLSKLLLLLRSYLHLSPANRACRENKGTENSWNMFIINHNNPKV